MGVPWLSLLFGSVADWPHEKRKSALRNQAMRHTTDRISGIIIFGYAPQLDFYPLFWLHIRLYRPGL